MVNFHDLQFDNLELSNYYAYLIFAASLTVSITPAVSTTNYMFLY